MSRTYRRSYNKSNKPIVYRHIIGDEPWIHYKTGRDVTFCVGTDNLNNTSFHKNLKTHAKSCRRNAEKRFIYNILHNKSFNNAVIESRFSDPWFWD